MTTLTHIAVGAVIAKTVLSGHNIHTDPGLVYAVAILFSNLPDIDVPIFGIRRTIRLNWNHRIHSFLHFPLFWVILLVAYQVGVPLNIRQPLTPYITIAGISLGIHFLLDSIGFNRGICWFGPFIKRQMSITRLVPEGKTVMASCLQYTKSMLFKMEVAIFIGCSLYLLVRR